MALFIAKREREREREREPRAAHVYTASLQPLPHSLSRASSRWPLGVSLTIPALMKSHPKSCLLICNRGQPSERALESAAEEGGGGGRGEERSIVLRSD